MRAPRRPVLLAAAALTVLGAGATAASAVAAPATTSPDTGLVRLVDNVLPNLSSLTARGAATPTTEMEVGVALTRPDAAAEDALLAAVYNPASPDYHHFLTPAQIARRFGAPAAATADVVNRMKAAGLRIDVVSTAGDYISVVGPVSAIEKAFDVQEMNYRYRGIDFIANTDGPVIPAADHVLSVVGLNTLQRFTPADGAASKHTAQGGPCEAGICLGLTTPSDLYSVYDEPAAYTGKGQTMAIIGEGNPTNTLNNLKYFEKEFKLPVVTMTVDCVQDHSCGTDTAGDGEWQIDTQASTSMAPGVTGETLYFSQAEVDSSINLAFLAWLDNANGPKQASASLGECEETPANAAFTGPLGFTNGNQNLGTTGVLGFGNGEESVLDPHLRDADLEGRTLFSSSGDTGSSCGFVYLPELGGGNGIVNDGVPDVDYPAASPYAVAVGGTVLYTTENSKPTTRALETAWTYTGGGTSFFEPAPSWQKKTAGIDLPCVSSPTGSTSDTGVLCRGVPDVAAQSGDIVTNGYTVCTAPVPGTPGSCGFAGGTSLSSPLWLGMWTRVQSAAAKNIGFAAPALYTVGDNPTTYARDFYDITVGTNGVYHAGSGWDYTTGLGVPKVAGLIEDIAKSTKTIATAQQEAATEAATGPGSPAATHTATGALATTGLDLGIPGAVALALLVAAAVALPRRRRDETPVQS